MEERIQKLEREIQRLGDRVAVMELMSQARSDLVTQCLVQLLSTESGEDAKTLRDQLEEGFRLAVHGRLKTMKDKERAALLLAAFDPSAREINDLLRESEDDDLS